MTALTIVYAALFYLATAVLVVGLALKIRGYVRTPAPLKIPTTPAPVTRTGVALRLTREVVFFESLFKSSKWTWLFGWLFHAALLLVLLRHLRYFQQPVWTPVAWVQAFGTYAGFAMVAGLAGLLFLKGRPERALILAWAAVLVVFSGLDVSFNFLLKHHYATMVPVAVGLGLLLDRLGRSPRGSLAGAGLLALLLALGVRSALDTGLGLIP